MFQSPSGKKDPMDGEYIGNIWGWKFSMFGLVIILLMLGIMAYRHYALDVPLNQGIEVENSYDKLFEE